MSSRTNHADRPEVTFRPDDWENSRAFGINKQPPRASAWFAPDGETALAVSYRRHGRSPWVMCLNGNWQFRWVPHPDLRPIDFHEPEFDASGWGAIPVPSHWQLMGYGTPIYSNSRYPFKDEANVEAHGISYRRRALPGDLPEWQDAAVDRMRRMVVRDRTHPCIVMWSLGNQAGFGDAFQAMADECRRLDPAARPIQYADMNLPCDIDSQTYPDGDGIESRIRSCLGGDGPWAHVRRCTPPTPLPQSRPRPRWGRRTGP